jgi:outer membrane protein OmpA-like peptidoglycan-associated protein
MTRILNKRMAMWVPVVAAVVSLTGACGGDSSDTSAPPETSAEQSAEAPEDTMTLPPGATAGLDDLNQDGEPDPVCGTRDFGAGLVLQIPCDATGYASEPSEGVTLVPGSLFSLPAINDELKSATLSESSANAIQARDPDGKQVYVYFIQSDTLFEVGSSALSDPAKDTLDGLARGIQSTWPTASVQVRGHTDSTGTAASNQALSEQRASNVAAYLATRGIDQSRLSSLGLGPEFPIAVEDGAAGQRENRRVELVVRLP